MRKDRRVGEGAIVHHASTAVVLVLLLSMPPILVATIVGVLVSLIQALTQIQEQTLGFAIKLIAVVITMVATAPWVGAQMVQYTRQILEEFPALTR
jgi:type III secretion HrpO family protein